MRRVESVAYIRRSARSRTDPGDLSREFQVEKVMALAGPDAARVQVIDADWGRSASTDKTGRRTAFLELMDRVERGEVDVLYAYATDRLARSVEWAARLLNACRRAGTLIVTSEGRFEPDNAMTDQLFYFQAMQNEGYSRQAQQKRIATVAAQRARGDKLGPSFYGSKPGEDLAAVLSAFDGAGSAHGAARLLNAWKVPTRRGGTWSRASVQQILVREGRIRAHGTRGAKPRAPFTLYRLLRCPCGRTLTGVRNRRLRGRERPVPLVLYRCIGGSADPGHHVKSVAESKVLGPVRAAVDALRRPDRVQMAVDAAERREALEARRRRVVDNYEDGLIGRDERSAKVAAIDEQLAALEDDAQAVDVPAIDWSWPPADLNRLLRLLIERVELGPDLRPLPDGIKWRGRIAEWATA